MPDVRFGKFIIQCHIYTFTLRVLSERNVERDAFGIKAKHARTLLHNRNNIDPTRKYFRPRNITRVPRTTTRQISRIRSAGLTFETFSNFARQAPIDVTTLARTLFSLATIDPVRRKRNTGFHGWGSTTLYTLYNSCITHSAGLVRLFFRRDKRKRRSTV